MEREKMDSFGNKKLILFYILDIFREFTDEDHLLLQKDIQKKLNDVYGIDVDRKTIAPNIEKLIDSGFDIIKDTKGYYLGEREFEPSEISFLIDAVFSSKTISGKMSQDLAEKLSKFLSKYKQKNYKYIYKSSEIARTDNKQLFYTIDVLHEAIEKKKQVEFSYDRPYITAGKKQKQEARRYVVNPYFLVNSQGKYYLVCNYDRYNDIANYKLEQIKDINILESKAKPVTKVEGYEKGLDIAKYANENIYMITSKSVLATIKMKDEYAVTVITDWFGKDVNFFTKNGEQFATVNASEMAIIYWCLQYGKYLELVSPESTREQIKAEIERLKETYK